MYRIMCLLWAAFEADIITQTISKLKEMIISSHEFLNAREDLVAQNTDFQVMDLSRVLMSYYPCVLRLPSQIAYLLEE